MDFPAFDFEPSNELGVVLLFGRYYEALGFNAVAHLGGQFPDSRCGRRLPFL